MIDDQIVIKVENLSKAYKLYDRPVDRLKESIHPFRKQYHRDFYALNNISFEVKKGESVGIIGKNGSGKSTLLKILTGVLTPTSGSASVIGKVSSLLELGAGFNFEMTGIENVYFNGTVMGFSKEEMDAKIDEILAFADIGDFVHQPVKTYSSGMFVRLAFAASIAVDPDVLIIDEALAVGDMSFQIKCFGRMNQLREKGATILFVSHSLSTVLSFCKQALYLQQGQQMGFGPATVVVKQYQQDCIADKMVPRYSMTSLGEVSAERMPVFDLSTVEAERLETVALDNRNNFLAVAARGTREGSQTVTIESFVLVSPDAIPVASISPTEEIAGCFLLKSNAKFEGSIHLSIQVLDKCGSPVMVVRDSAFEQSVAGVPGKRWMGLMRFALPLQAGIYYCKIGVVLYPPFEKYKHGRHNFGEAEVSDLVEHGAHIEVLSFARHPIPLPVLNESKLSLTSLGESA